MLGSQLVCWWHYTAIYNYYQARQLHNVILLCGPVPWPWNMPIIVHGPPYKVRIFVYNSCIQVELGNFGWSYIPGTMCMNYYYPINIHKKHCSSQYYSFIILFVASLLFQIPTLFTIFLLLKPTLSVIRTGVIFFLFSKFLPHEGKILEAHVVG